MRDFRNVQHKRVNLTAGQTSDPVKLKTARDSRFLILTARARVVISVAAATAIRNLGQVWSIFDRGHLSEGGPDIGTFDLRAMAFTSEFLRSSPGTQTRLTSAAIGTANLVERLMIPFERLQAVLRETRYRVADPGVDFSLTFDIHSSPAARLLDVGGATVVVDQMSVDVRQYLAGKGDVALPVYKPAWLLQQLAIGGTGTAELELQVGRDRLRGLTILQETSAVGLVSDIVTGIRLLDDEEEYIGEDGFVTYSDVAADHEWFSGGNIFAANSGSIVHLDFQEAGRLAHTLSVPRERNLRVMFDAAVSASAGSSRIILQSHLLSRDKAVGKSGRRIVSVDDPVPAS